MSASKFCRNFLTFPRMGARENSCHTTREKQHRNNDLKKQEARDFHMAAQVNTEEQEDLDVPLVLVFFPKSITEHKDYGPSSLQTNNDRDKRSACFWRAKVVVYSKLPPCSTPLGDRGLFHINDQEKPFACGFCGKAYKRKRAVYGHIRMQHDEKRYSCEFCSKRYAQKSDLSNHVTMHTQEKPFTCDQCDKCFRLQGGLRHHKYTHSEERPFPCKKCNKSFKTKEGLSRHGESHKKYEQRKSVICSICKRKFLGSSNLKVHMMIHAGEKPFKCSLCEKQFHTKILLRSHMDSHSGKRRLANKPCSVCGKTVWASYMPTHMRMHTGEKPFECSICKKRFPKKTNLEGHMRSHTGEKPFACSRCDKRFSLYSNMMTHNAKC